MCECIVYVCCVCMLFVLFFVICSLLVKSMSSHIQTTMGAEVRQLRQEVRDLRSAVGLDGSNARRCRQDNPAAAPAVPTSTTQQSFGRAHTAPVCSSVAPMPMPSASHGAAVFAAPPVARSVVPETTQPAAGHTLSDPTGARLPPPSNGGVAPQMGGVFPVSAVSRALTTAAPSSTASTHPLDAQCLLVPAPGLADMSGTAASATIRRTPAPAAVTAGSGAPFPAGSIPYAVAASGPIATAGFPNGVAVQPQFASFPAYSSAPMHSGAGPAPAPVFVPAPQAAAPTPLEALWHIARPPAAAPPTTLAPPAPQMASGVHVGDAGSLVVPGGFLAWPPSVAVPPGSVLVPLSVHPAPHNTVLYAMPATSGAPNIQFGFP